MTEVGYMTKGISLPTYKKMKINMLVKDFKFSLTVEERDHLNQLESELAVDRYCRTLYHKYLFKE